MGKFLESFPVVFGEAVLNGDNGEGFAQFFVEIDHFVGSQAAALAGEDILLGFLVIKFGSGRVKGEKNV